MKLIDETRAAELFCEMFRPQLQQVAAYLETLPDAPPSPQAREWPKAAAKGESAEVARLKAEISLLSDYGVVARLRAEVERLRQVPSQLELQAILDPVYSTYSIPVYAAAVHFYLVERAGKLEQPAIPPTERKSGYYLNGVWVDVNDADVWAERAAPLDPLTPEQTRILPEKTPQPEQPAGTEPFVTVRKEWAGAVARTGPRPKQPAKPTRESLLIDRSSEDHSTQ